MAIPGNLLSTVTESVDPNTSGWTKHLNCTITKGTGGRTGDGCLVVKSVAAGEMQARTVSSYTVVPGVVYQTFADAAGVVPERIGIRWLNASNAQISITWGLATATASSGWHRVGVAGAAPSGAARAQVLVSSTPAAGNVNQYWENFYLGLPVRTTGNLFGFNTESAEVDGSGWTAQVNATVARQAPMVAWAVDAYTSGGHVIAMTATAAGNAAMRTVERPTVTPGVQYLAYAHLNPPTAAATTWVELRFYDAVGNQINATRSTLAAPGTGYYKQRVSAVAPGNAATCAIAVGVDGASAGQVLRTETVVVTTAPELYGGTVVPYADASFEQGVTGWATVSGVAAIARSTPWGFAWWDGAYALKVSSTTATASTIRSAKFPVGAAAGLGWRHQIIATVAAGGWTLSVRVHWYDAANADLGTTTGTLYTFPDADWYSLSNDSVAPAGATQAALEYIATATATNSTLYIDQPGLWESLPLTAVEAVDDTASVTLTLRELNLGYGLTVYRVGPDGARTLVRGPSGLLDQTEITSDLMVIEDYEAPLNTEVYYQIELLAPGDTIAATRTSDAVTITHTDRNQVWLKDPGQPQRNLKVVAQRPPDWQRPVEQSVYRVRGRRNAVILSGQRSGLEGELSVFTTTDDERDALDWLLNSGNTILWQAAPGMGESDVYVNVGEITTTRGGGVAMDPIRVWSLPLTQTDMPVTTGVGGSAGRTWQDILTEFDTWGDLLTTYATWEDVFLDQRIGG